MSRLNKKEGIVYLLKCQNYYKIGRTLNLGYRVYQYEMHNPFKIEIVLAKTVDDFVGVETELLNRLIYKQIEGKQVRKERARSEWFELNENSIKAIKNYLFVELEKGKSPNIIPIDSTYIR